MLKKYEVVTIIANALEELDGVLSPMADEDGKHTLYEAKVEEDENHNLIFTFKEDCLSDEQSDKYRIRVEYCEE